MLAGYRNGYVNKLAYPYSGYTYWTMSPYYFGSSSSTANEFILNNDGIALSYWMTGSYGVRPVVNLNADVEITGGIGTQNEPFIVKTT